MTLSLHILEFLIEPACLLAKKERKSPPGEKLGFQQESAAKAGTR